MSHVFPVEIRPAFSETPINRLSPKVIVEARHYDALSINNRYAEFFPELFDRIAFPLDRFMLQDSLSELLTIALSPDPSLTDDAEAEGIFEDDYRMEMPHNQEPAPQQWW